MQTQVDTTPTEQLMATPVPDLVSAAQATLEEAQAKAAQAGERRALLAARLGAATGRELQLRAAEARARERHQALLTDLDVLPGSKEPYAQRLREEAGQLRCWLAALESALAEARCWRADLQAQEGRLEQQLAETQERARAAQAALEAARCAQPLHDLAGVLEDTLDGPLTVVDATIGPTGLTCWLTDGPHTDYMRTADQKTWPVTDFPAYRAAYPRLPAEWLVEPQYQRQQACGRLTMPGDGLLTVDESLAIIRRLARGDANARLVGLHWSMVHPETGRHAYVLVVQDGVRRLDVDTFGRAQQIIGGL